MGIEEDHCGNIENAKRAFGKAYELIRETHGDEDPFAQNCLTAYDKILQVILDLLS